MPPSKPQTVGWVTCAVLVLLALFLAGFYRLPYLDTRPMHTDEAILGVKFIDFATSGRFNYDPSDYHGPMLHYLTRAYGWFAGWSDYATLEATNLRRVVVVCSLLLLLSTLLLGDALGRFATASSMLMMAVSPMMVFYSRYYIMEVPYVLWLTLFMASCWRYSQSKNWLWLLVAGVCVGLLHATKETFIINLCAMLCGWIAVRVMGMSFDPKSSSSSSSRKESALRPWIIVTVVAVVVSVTLFSGFFQHWDDVQESVTTYANYWKRSGGVGHEKPWNYYLGLLCWQQEGYGYIWSELMIAGLAVIGALHAFLGDFYKQERLQGFRVFLTVYALASLTVYSLLPYKTPWVILSVQYALTLLAGLGLQAILGNLQSHLPRFIVGALFLAGIYHLCMQTMRTIHDGRGKISNPYMYSHTGTRAVELSKVLQELSVVAGDSFALQCFTRDAGWPLPWYMRGIKHATYGVDMPDAINAPVVVADSSHYAQTKAKMTMPCYEDTFNMRPAVSVVLLVEQSLWDRYLAQHKTESKP